MRTNVFGQGLARLQAQRQRRGLGFDIGIAVTVAADPGTETQQAGNPDVLRAFRDTRGARSFSRWRYIIGTAWNRHSLK